MFRCREKDLLDGLQSWPPMTMQVSNVSTKTGITYHLTCDIQTLRRVEMKALVA